MTIKLTRQELYDLVWSKPMIHAAKELGISDVMLGKICKEQKIPKPPQGYWAALLSPKKRDKYVKPPLLELPEPERDFNRMVLEEYEQREAARTDIFNPENLDDPVKDPPKAFAESIDEFQKRIELIYPSFSNSISSDLHHLITQKVLKEDLVLAAEYRRDRYKERPKYQDEVGKQLLKLLNMFIMCFEKLGFEVNVTGRKYFRFYVSLFKQYRQFHVYMDHGNQTYPFRKKEVENKPISYHFVWTDDYDDRGRRSKSYEFIQIDTDCVKQVVIDKIIKVEKSYRESVFRSYEYAVSARQSAIEANNRRIREEAERKKIAIERLLAKRLELMNEATENMYQADKIRELINAMEIKAKKSKKNIEGLKNWIGWANHHAEIIDPRHMSLDSFEAWIKKFKLKN